MKEKEQLKRSNLQQKKMFLLQRSLYLTNKLKLMNESKEIKSKVHLILRKILVMFWKLGFFKNLELDLYFLHY